MKSKNTRLSREKKRVVVALDSFKGCASSAETTSWLAQGLRLALPESHQVVEVPVCDGGTGFAQIISSADKKATHHTVTSFDATGVTIENGRVTIVKSGKRRIAVLESADTIGLGRLTDERQGEISVMRRNSYGLGLVIAFAADLKPDEILLGMGDSAVQDCGAGLLAALGAEFIVENNKCIKGPLVAVENLLHIKQIDLSKLRRLPPIRLACNLSSVLSGSSSTVENYARQKGATDAEVKQLKAWTERFDLLLSKHAGFRVGFHPGSGSSGGVGSALIAACGAVPEYSFLTVNRAIGIQRKVCRADVVVVGEGRIDAGTAKGKAPGAVALMASAVGIPVIAVAGSVEAGTFGSLLAAGISSMQTLSTPSQKLVDYMDPTKARRLLRETGVRISPLVSMFASGRSQDISQTQRDSPRSKKRLKVKQAPIVFDLWQTVVTRTWKYNYVEKLSRALGEAGLGVGHAMIQQCLNVSMLRHSTSPAHFVKTLVPFVSQSGSSVPEITRTVSHILKGLSQDQLRESKWIDGAEDFLSMLKDQAVPLVAVSNSTQQARETLRRLGAHRWFDEIILSCEHGLTKPHLGLFLRSNHVSTAFANGTCGLIIGDQFEKDIMPAQLLGFDAILIRHFRPSRPSMWSRCSPKIGMASSFQDAMDLLESRPLQNAI